MDDTAEVFIKLLRCAVTGSDADIDYKGVTYGRLFELAMRHSLAHIMYYELKKREALPTNEEMRRELERHWLSARRQVALRLFAISGIEKIFGENGVPFILLKGAHMTKLYPKPWMRSSADVDVLVKPCDLERAAELLINAGLQKDSECGHHLGFVFKEGFYTELHFSLIDEGVLPRAEKILSNIWDYAAPREGFAYEYVLSDEAFYFYHTAHMAVHFKLGGCGVRTVLDLWLLNNRTGFDAEKRGRLLSQGGLGAFESRIKQLSEIWFSGAQNDGSLDDLASFIMDGGIYGTLKQNAEAGRTAKGGKFSYYVNRLFMPYSNMKHNYPILKKVPVLLPVCWAARWFKLLEPERRKRIGREIGYTEGITNSDKERLSQLFSELEI